MKEELQVSSTSQIRSPLAHAGAILKQRRKEQNISLKEAENATSIRMAYLQSIEEGDLSKLISPVYAQGFFRQYAAFLGVDGDSMIRENPEIFARPTTQEFSYGIGTLETRNNPGDGIKWIPNALAVGAVVLVLLVAWYFAKFLEVI